MSGSRFAGPDTFSRMGSSDAPQGWQPWKSAISDSDGEHLWYRGRDVTQLMTANTFSDVVFLLHQGRLPVEGERRLMDAILIAAADHGPGSPSAAAARLVASGNRVSPEAAVGAGVLAMGDVHAGAGHACMSLVETGLRRAQEQSLSLADAAAQLVRESRERGERVPGFGHRVHTAVDPRTAVLFGMARDHALAGDGIRFVEALEQAIAAQIKPLPINIDGALAGILIDLGFAPMFGKFIFIIGRVAGLTAQVAEEHTRERPMRIRIPVTYDGPPPRDVK
jgi:citrate synthase